MSRCYVASQPRVRILGAFIVVQCFSITRAIPAALSPYACCRSMYNFFMNTSTAPVEKESSDLVDNASATTSEDEPKPFFPKIESKDVDMTSSRSTAYSSATSDESWARGVFDKRRQPADTKEGGHGEGSASAAGAATAPGGATAAPAGPEEDLGEASGFAGAFGGSSVGPEPHPRGTGLGSGFGARAGSAGSIAASSISSGTSSNSVGPVGAGSSGGVASTPPPPAAAAVAAPFTAAGQDANRSLDQRERDGAALLPLLPLVPPTPTSNAAPGPAGSGGNGNGNTRLELLDTSELEGAEAAGLLDAVDALLGEAALEGFGEGGSEEDMVPFFEGNV